MNLDYRCLKVLDDKNVRRRFRASNYQSTTRVKPFICTMPMRLDEGWNQIQFNLSDFTRRAYGTNYIETLRVQVKPRKQSRENKRFLDSRKLSHSPSLLLRSFVQRRRVTGRVQALLARTEQNCAKGIKIINSLSFLIKSKYALQAIV